jgi:hypothetical protein
MEIWRVDGFTLAFWSIMAIGTYSFYPPFRKWTNGQIVKIADKIRADASPPNENTNIHIVEDIAFAHFKEDHPQDPRSEGRWMDLPIEVRKTYILKGAETLVRLNGQLSAPSQQSASVKQDS